MMDAGVDGSPCSLGFDASDSRYFSFASESEMCAPRELRAELIPESLPVPWLIPVKGEAGTWLRRRSRYGSSSCPFESVEGGVSTGLIGYGCRECSVEGPGTGPERLGLYGAALPYGSKVGGGRATGVGVIDVPRSPGESARPGLAKGTSAYWTGGNSSGCC